MIRSLVSEEQFSRRVLTGSFLFTLVAFGVGVQLLASRHSSLRAQDIAGSPPLLEAELLKAPAEPAHLTEFKKASAPQAPLEKAISLSTAAKGAASPLKATDLVQENQATAAAPVAPPTHGPTVLESPTPKLPSYLRDQNLKTSVLIEFTIQADGGSQPHLIGTSGNDEIDALALRSAKQWRFSAALENGRSLPSKIRLRINFQVDEN